jgi:hypothetical protein
MMLNEVCLEINNFFNRNQPRLIGDFEISDGKITDTDFLAKIKEDQYFRIVGSIFNDGVYKYTEELELKDEEFHGALWLMAIPSDFLNLVGEIEEWQQKNGGVDSANMSPFSSESFGGYSYSKASGGSSESGASSVPTWQSQYASRLSLYRRISAL